MGETQQSVFSVNTRHGKIWLRLGFCEGYMTLPRIVIPFRSFTKQVIHVDLGMIECRRRWYPPPGLERTHSAMVLHPWQSWMDVEVDAVLDAVRACRSLSRPLPPGFLRYFH